MGTRRERSFGVSILPTSPALHPRADGMEYLGIKVLRRNKDRNYFQNPGFRIYQQNGLDSLHPGGIYTIACFRISWKCCTDANPRPVSTSSTFRECDTCFVSLCIPYFAISCDNLGKTMSNILNEEM